MVKKKLRRNTSKRVEKSAPQKKSKPLFTNYWALATIILAILLIIALFTGRAPSITAETAEQKLIDFAESQGVSIEITKTEKEAGMYKLSFVSDEGLEGTFFITNDGKSLIPSQAIVPLEGGSAQSTPGAQPTPDEIPKSDKPTVELFVMSHCPFGTQAEKGILPVVNLLGDKIDMEFKFVYYAMHGELEVVEQHNQYCIQEEQNDKYPVVQAGDRLPHFDRQVCRGKTQ